MRLRQLFPILFILVILLLAIQAIRYELRDTSLQQVWQSIQLIPLDHLSGALLLTLLGYLTVTGYDLLGFQYIRRSLEPIKIIFTSFLSYAIGNTIGFTIFSGGAIRYRFYTPWGVSAIDVAKLVAFTHLSFWLGMLALGGVVFLIDPLTIPQILHLPFASLHPIGILFLIITAVYLLLSVQLKQPLRIRQEEFTLPSAPLSVGLIVLSAIDWMLAAGVLYLLMPIPMPISYFSFFGIYVL
ncbi:MAG TPA: YbhN family protein, partial [Allocoleopsis sp.]